MSEIADQYRLVPDIDGNDDSWCIELTEGKFNGVIYRYGKVKLQLNEEDEDAGLTANFVYDILSVPTELREQEFEDEVKWEFEHHLGNILMDVVQTSIDNSEVSQTEDDDGRLIIKRKVTF